MNKHSRVCANIDLSAVMHNMEAMHQNIDPDTKIMAVIKADGYGHGAVPVHAERAGEAGHHLQDLELPPGRVYRLVDVYGVQADLRLWKVL